MKNKYLLFVVFSLALAFIACEKDKGTPESNLDTNKLNIVRDQAILDARVETVNIPIQFKGSAAADLSYTWVANINSSNVTLSASTVDAFEDNVYVGWHARGLDVVGELSYVSMEDEENPEMIAFWPLANQEINDLEVKPAIDKLFIAGAATANLDNNSIGDRTSMALAMNLDSDGGFDDLDLEHYLYGYSANSITYVPNQTLWVSKGSQGGLTVFRDYDPEDVKLESEMSNTKHFDATGDWGALLYGVGFNESVLRVYDMNNTLYEYDEEYTIPYDVTPQGKNAVDINGDYAYLAMGNDGIVKVDLTNGDVVNTFDYDNGGFCNGVTVDWRWIYAAYGADGLFVIDKETFEVLGNWNFDGSCNYVKKVDDHLFLANGDTGGLIILKKD